MYYVGIDIGGTFTDTVVIDEAGRVKMYKAPTTPEDRSIGVLDALALAAQDQELPVEDFLEQTAYFGHGTTAATNALIEYKGAKTGLITTRGFRDAVLIQRSMGGWSGSPELITHYSERSLPTPIVPRPLIREVSERVDYKGKVIVPLNEDEVRRTLRRLRDEGVEAIGVSLLWSFLNPAHERAIKRIAAEETPELFVSLSSELVPVLGEYERTATTVINAYLSPVIASYVGNLESKLQQMGLRERLTIMDSSGGVMPAAESSSRAVGLLSSGPAGGVLASVQLGKSLGYENIITTDMGGTSFDVSVIANGEPSMAKISTVGKYHVAQPMIDITAIGSGGGSIARVLAGFLTVGPESAGAEPGPVCYDRGGTEPTITDADVVLGIIDPDFFLGGRMKLNRKKAEGAIREKIAEPLGITVEQAAAGIRQIADFQLADLLRNVTVGQGYDPRDFVIFAYGGAGPTHCYAYGRESNARAVVVPHTATVHSAFGAVTSDLHQSFLLSAPLATPPGFDLASKFIDAARINEPFDRLEGAGRAAMRENNVADENIRIQRTLELRYRQQVNEVTVPVKNGALESPDIDRVVDDFEKKYEGLYGEGTGVREAGIEIVTFRVDVTGLLAKPAMSPESPPYGRVEDARTGTRQVYFRETAGFIPTTIYLGERLPSGAEVEGPAIIEHSGTTIVVGPSQTARIDEGLNTIIELDYPEDVEETIGSTGTAVRSG